MSSSPPQGRRENDTRRGSSFHSALRTLRELQQYVQTTPSDSRSNFPTGQDVPVGSIDSLAQMDVDEGAGAESPLQDPERVADRTRRQYRSGGRGRRENSRERRGGAILPFDSVVEDEEPMWELEGPSAVMSSRDALATLRERVPWNSAALSSYRRYSLGNEEPELSRSDAADERAVEMTTRSIPERGDDDLSEGEMELVAEGLHPLHPTPTRKEEVTTEAGGSYPVNPLGFTRVLAVGRHCKASQRTTPRYQPRPDSGRTDLRVALRYACSSSGCAAGVPC